MDEAIRIVFDSEIPRHRPADTHDVAETWPIVSDAREMARTPGDFRQLACLLRECHRRIMAGRPETLPGEFKTEENRAGQTVFVAPDLVFRAPWPRDSPCTEPGVALRARRLYDVPRH